MTSSEQPEVQPDGPVSHQRDPEADRPVPREGEDTPEREQGDPGTEGHHDN